MAAKTFLLVLSVACAVQSMNAWPWSKKPTQQPPLPSRDEFLAQVQAAVQSVQREVELSRQKVEAFNASDKEAEMEAKIVDDVDAWNAKQFAQVQAYADRLIKMAAEASVDASATIGHCVERYEPEIGQVLPYLLKNSRQYLATDIKDVRDTADKAKALRTQVAAVAQRAQAEAAKPDGEYGAEVEAILKEAGEVASNAEWNNKHIDAVLNGLKLSADSGIMLSDGNDDARDIKGCIDLCVRRAYRAAMAAPHQKQD